MKMGRKCSQCGNIGHNSRTCNMSKGAIAIAVGGGVRLFGVQLDMISASSSSSSSSYSIPMKKSFSLDCLSSSSPTSSLSSTRFPINEHPADKSSLGYLSDGPLARIPERKKGVPWTEEEHRTFLIGLEKLGKGDWRGISRNYVTSRTPTQVASHAQKYFLRQASITNKKRRSSLFDMVDGNGNGNAGNSGTVSTDSKWRVHLDLNSFGDDECKKSSDQGCGKILAMASREESIWGSCESSRNYNITANAAPANLELELTLSASDKMQQHECSPAALLMGAISVT